MIIILINILYYSYNILYSLLLMYCYLRIVHFYVKLPPGTGPITVGNK
jgi:hypothetical protein